MRKLLNTLYVTSANSYLGREGENVVVKVDNEQRFRMPVHNLEAIVTFGYQGASPSLMSLCAQNKVALSFMSTTGKFLGRVSGPTSGNVLLRRTQYRMADDPMINVAISRLFVSGKIANARTVLLRAMRDHPEKLDLARIHKASERMAIRQKLALVADTNDKLRGLEGDSARTYFSVFDELILQQKSSFRLDGRNRRPPRDNVNALLSFVYTLLMHETRAALESVGLDPYVGFLHADRPGRPGLALDLMEEFRPFLADRLVLTLINRQQINGKGFVSQPTGGIVMRDETRKEVLTAWQTRKKEEVIHPFLGEKVPVGLLPYCQALLLARFIRGDLNNYPVFVSK